MHHTSPTTAEFAMMNPKNTLHRQRRAQAVAVAGLVGLLAVLGTAGAATAAVDFTTSMTPAANLICNSAKGFIASPLLTAAAFVMFIGGAVMVYAKIRGGLGLLITAFVGYVLLKQIVPIAVALKIAPNGC